jgi:sigma-B regulation protein RsbU (phosphoserine phosphatase)
MPEASLEVTDALGRRVIVIEKSPFAIGRRETNDLRLGGSEVSRDHAEILLDGDSHLIRDRGSRFGTFINGEALAGDRRLRSGDVVRLGRGGGAELVYRSGSQMESVSVPAAAAAIGDLRHVAALLEGLRALGTGRVLDDVLALVLDSAIQVSGAERGFIMLSAEDEHSLEFKMGRGRGQAPLEGSRFQTSRKIPEEVFETGQPRLIADLLDGELANVHMGTVALGIRHVLCVPLKVVRYVDEADAAPADERRIGVLYLDSRERGTLLSSTTRAALETLATEAAIAIENARLYRSALEKAKLEQEIRIAAEIQQALLPKPRHEGGFFDAAGATIPCRSIGGDFYDVIDLPGGVFGFGLGDVAGKGPPAALLSAMVQGIIAAQSMSTDGPATTLARVNHAMIRRAIAARYATMFYAVLEESGRLAFCNAGHNPPIVVGSRGVRRLEVGGPPLGLFESLPYEEGVIALDPGDRIVVFSDGISEALSASGDEFGDDRIVDVALREASGDAGAILSALVSSVREFAAGAPQYDDITALVVAYRGRPA